MASQAGLVTGYRPSLYSGDGSLESLRNYLESELLAISRAMTEMLEIELRPRTAEPGKPREGMIVFADGTLWNPGSGKGLYVYKGGVWTHIV